MFKLKLAYHKFRHWEYWPVWLVYLPCFFQYLIYAIRSKSPFFFTAANPGITNGGAFFVPKDEIYKKLPKEICPLTKVINESTPLVEIKSWLVKNNLSYPILLKPNHGLRGLGLIIIKSEKELNNFLSQVQAEYLVQEFIEYPNELGIFFIKQTKENNLAVTSIVKKDFMNIKGDGTSSITELLKANKRYAVQIESLREHTDINFSTILPKDKIFEFDRIGNHSRGAIFLDGSEFHSLNLEHRIKEILNQIHGVYYGRIDLKYDNLEDFLAGNKFKVIELNGAFSEPAHIYDPKHNIWFAWKVIIKHFDQLFKTSIALIDLGHQPLKLKEGMTSLSQHFKATKALSRI